MLEILKKFNVVYDPETFDEELNNVELYQALFFHYLPEMPYGTAKARTGDPFQFIARKVDEEITSL